MVNGHHKSQMADSDSEFFINNSYSVKTCLQNGVVDRFFHKESRFVACVILKY